MKNWSLAQVTDVTVCISTGIPVETVTHDEVRADKILIILGIFTDAQIL